MVLPLTQTETLTLTQAVQENHARYNRLRVRRDSGAPDYLVLTAANERQAAAYRLELAERERSRFFPAGLRVLVTADPAGQRIGSGGATLNALRAVARDLWRQDRALLRDAASVTDLFLGQRILILHSGGDSKRLPHCAASGKIFAELPLEAVDGRASTLFDELFLLLADVLERLGPGLLIASGDVLPVFAAGAVRPAAEGVTGFAIAAPAEQAVHHGVYVTERGHGVHTFLHKQDEATLRAGGALDALGRAWIDTGLVAFAGAGLDALASLAGIHLGKRGLSLRRELLPPQCAGSLDLYDEILPALPSAADREQYLSRGGSQSEGRQLLWTRFHGLRFEAQQLAPAQFLHLGTTVEYGETIAPNGPLHALYHTRSILQAQLSPTVDADGATITTSYLAEAEGKIGAGAIIQGAHLAGTLSLAPGSLLSGLQANQANLHLRPGVVLHQVPVRFPADYPAPELRGKAAFATYLFGVKDNPKGLLAKEACRLFDASITQRLEKWDITPEVLWDSVKPEERCLWNARLYPVTMSSDDLLPVLWLQEDREPTAAERQRWEESPRLSLSDMARLTDCEALVAARRRLAAELVRTELRKALAKEVPTAAILAHTDLTDDAAETRQALAQLAQESKPLAQARIHYTHARLLDALAEQATKLPEALIWRRRADQCEEDAFAAVRTALGTVQLADESPTLALPLGEAVTVALPVRIDFGGGWSDTPPHSLEHGGTVLNAAILLDGVHPVRATVRAIPACELRLEARDLGSHIRITRLAEALAYQDPGDPFALHKAALVQAGIVRSGRGSLRACLHCFGGGLEVSTESRVPKGSGLGTSSILGACLAAALRALRGAPTSEQALFADVLQIEQMLTTGGGWQDQVGGLVPGIKLISAAPGLAQTLSVEPVELSPAVMDALQQRMVLVYVGHRRLAKNILRIVMGRYLARDPEVVHILTRIQEIAREMRTDLLSGDLDHFGALMAEHWELNKRMDPNSSNRHVEAVLTAAAPYASGYKMAGAGGGGFAEILARTSADAQRLRDAVQDAGGQVYSWNFAQQALAASTLTRQC